MAKRIGNYELVERIGKGAFGRIYRARQLSLEREVALKVLSLEVTANAEFVEFFLREARLAAGLNHPHIVTVIDVGRKSGRYFYAMEFVDGTDLARLVKRDGPLEPRRALDHLLAMAGALAYAHGHGVVHHDVKPANMLLREDGRLLLGDFGVARPVAPAAEVDDQADTEDAEDAVAAGEGSEPDAETEPGDDADSGRRFDRRIVGSPPFMAPEVCRGLPGDARSDLYGLGASFFFLISGRKLYRGDQLQILAQQVRAPVPSLRKHRPDCPRRLAALVENLLAKDPDERPPSAAALLAALRELKENWAHADRPVSSRRLRRRTTKRYRRKR